MELVASFGHIKAAINNGVEMKRTSTTAARSPKRLPPVRIPLPFEKAVEGLLAVDPKGPVRQKGANKKGRKKTPKSGP
jgi:hypothetical protein